MKHNMTFFLVSFATVHMQHTMLTSTIAVYLPVNLVVILINMPMIFQQLSQSSKSESCYRSDVRLAENQRAYCEKFHNSGYEKGQLVSSRDLNFNKMAMLSTSTFSNIVPMYPVFREGALFFKYFKWTTVMWS